MSTPRPSESNTSAHPGACSVYTAPKEVKRYTCACGGGRGGLAAENTKHDESEEHHSIGKTRHEEVIGLFPTVRGCQDVGQSVHVADAQVLEEPSPGEEAVRTQPLLKCTGVL